MGKMNKTALRVDFARSLKLEFHGSKVTNDLRAGENTQHDADGLVAAVGVSCLAGYEDTDAERMSVNSAIRHVVGGRAKSLNVASTSHLGSFGPQS